MEQQTNSVPTDLKEAGAALWVWLSARCADSIESCRPLVHELCRVADSLAAVRKKLAEGGLLVSGSRGRYTKNPLADLEIKLSGQFSKLWKTLGLADKEEAPPLAAVPLSPNRTGSEEEDWTQ